MRKDLRIISLLLGLTTALVPIGGVRARSADVAMLSEPNLPRVVVAPVEDGDEDAPSREIARALAQALALGGNLSVIDADLSREALAYHRRAARPPAGREEGERLLSRSKELFFQFRTADALAAVDRAIAVLEARPEALSEMGAILVDAHLTRAMIEKSRGDGASARRSIGAALRVHPLLDLSAEGFPPSIRELFEEERGSRGAMPSGALAVSTSPAAAELFLNGMAVGTSPVEVALPAGSYRLLIRTNRYGDFERAVEVQEGKRVRVRERLRWSRRAEAGREEEGAAEVREGLRVAELFRADKAIFLDVDSEGQGQRVRARMVDRAMGSGQPPIAVKLAAEDAKAPAALADLARKLEGEAQADLTANPARMIDPRGMANPALLAHRRRPLLKSPLLWGIVGAVVAGGVGGGLAAALSGGGGQTGSVQVNFR